MTPASRAPVMRPTLSRTASRLMVDAAVGEAEATSVAVSVAIVDESGVMKELLRMDDAPLVSVQTALSKAYAAAAIGICHPMTSTPRSSRTLPLWPSLPRGRGWR
jgi:uncharacterized protein GlcG (DUF336 family)